MKKSLLVLLFIAQCNFAHASGGGSFEDSLADFISWVVLIILPIAGIYLFWKAHIYPEVLAEKNHHPQLQAIKTMCLLSLFVGGLLWPLALIWANYKYPEKDFPEEYAANEVQAADADDNQTSANASQENSKEEDPN